MTTYDVAFILKTDDDSFVNPPWLVIALRQQCVFQPNCLIILNFGLLLVTLDDLVRTTWGGVCALLWLHLEVATDCGRRCTM